MYESDFHFWPLLLKCDRLLWGTEIQNAACRRGWACERGRWSRSVVAKAELCRQTAPGAAVGPRYPNSSEAVVSFHGQGEIIRYLAARWAISAWRSAVSAGWEPGDSTRLARPVSEQSRATEPERCAGKWRLARSKRSFLLCFAPAWTEWTSKRLAALEVE